MMSTIVTSDTFVPGVPGVPDVDKWDKWDKWTSGQVDKFCTTIAI